MLDLILTKCDACRQPRFKWAVKHRRIWIEKLNQYALSKNKICGNCAKLYKPNIINKYVK